MLIDAVGLVEDGAGWRSRGIAREQFGVGCYYLPYGFCYCVDPIMNLYLLVRTVHIGCALVTFLGFCLRGYWMLIESPYLKHRLTRILPHVVDTLLLLSAVVLVVMSRQYPLQVDWVTLKIIFLLLYIVAGSYALHYGRTKLIRSGYLAVAVIAVIVIFAVAIIKPVF